MRCIALLARGQREPHGTSQASNGHMYLGAQAAAAAAEGLLIFRPPFLAPAACWWARMMPRAPSSPSIAASAGKSARASRTGLPGAPRYRGCTMGAWKVAKRSIRQSIITAWRSTAAAMVSWSMIPHGTPDARCSARWHSSASSTAGPSKPRASATAISSAALELRPAPMGSVVETVPLN